MNLWVRTLRQLAVLAVALFFFSCEDETSILGFKNPNKKFHVGFVDIALNNSSVLAIDSLITDLRPVDQNNIVDGILVGEYQDNELGKINAQSFLTMYARNTAALATTAVYDSVTVQFRLNFYGYGFSGTQQKRFTIHEITGDTLTLYNNHRYYANSPAPQYNPEPLGEAVATVDYDSLRKQIGLNSGQDTLLAKARLTDDFGGRLFNAAKAGFTTTGSQQLFKYNVKGLALVPGESPGILGINVVNSFGQHSQVMLHYHTLDDAGAVEDTLTRTFGFDYAGFTKIEGDRTGTELAAITQPYESFAPANDLRYMQSGAPVITKLDLSDFYSFADTVDNILVNSAEFIIDNVDAPLGSNPHAALMLRLMNNTTDQFANNDVSADRELVTPYYAVTSASEDYYMASSDGSVTVPAGISYNSETGKYSGFVTLFVQSIFANKNDTDGINENRLKYLALYPMSPSATRSVTRTVFHKDNVKLRVYYTRANPTP